MSDRADSLHSAIGKILVAVQTLPTGDLELRFHDGSTFVLSAHDGASEHLQLSPEPLPTGLPLSPLPTPSRPGAAILPTQKQSAYLVFIHSYNQVHGRPPAERELQDFFRTTPPSVHNMILTLERRGFISRVPGVARSIHLLIDPALLPRSIRK